MNTERRIANAIGGRTARACDICLTKRARWFCGADDAFLCQECDVSVHLANLVASRHERVRLDKTKKCSMSLEDSLPAWQGENTKRARTSRKNTTKASLIKQSKEQYSAGIVNAPPVVPELDIDETSLIDDDEQSYFRVPVFSPFEDELYNISNGVENIFTDEINIGIALDKSEHAQSNELDDFSEFVPCDMNLAELTEDVENLLGNGDEEEFGLHDSRQDGTINIFFDDNSVKVENYQEFEDTIAPRIDITLNCSQFTSMQEEADKVIPLTEADRTKHENEAQTKRKMFLKLNYEAILTAWDGHGSPWTTGNRPEFDPDNCWPDLISTCCTKDGDHQSFGGIKRSVTDGGREARVSRYREKRRTRLFSKKIRYEVRKLNAEKRPRIKGRFVKRTSLLAGPPNAATVYPYLN